MSFKQACWMFVVVGAFLIIQSINGQTATNSSTFDIPSIPIHNNTSRDQEGEDHDSEPLRNNGRGSYEANSQNFAAENNGTHGHPVDFFEQEMLEQTNKFRKKACAAELTEDDKLHQAAQKLAHAKANGNETTYSDSFNEINYELDTGDPLKITPLMIVETWFNSGSKYRADNETSAMDYSQLVWKSSQKFGVGHAYSGAKLFIVALFKPPGNIQGQYVSNVGCDEKGSTTK